MSAAYDAETLKLLANSVDAFAQSPGELRQAPDAQVWQAYARLGWLGVMVPEPRGGTGLGLHAAAVIARRLGYAGYVAPYVGAGVMPSALLAECEPSAAIDERMGALLDGSTMAAIAWQGDGVASGSSTLRLERRSNAEVVNGTCRFVCGAGAGALIVAAQGDDGLALHWLDLPARGVRASPERAADGTALVRIDFEAAPMSGALPLARGEAARQALDRAIDCRIVATSAELLGIADRALQLTLDHLRTRCQFGQPIGAFQVLQHRSVDMWIQRELADAALHASLAAFEDGRTSAQARGAAASSAKSRAAQAALHICTQSIQLHGAIGFTDEYPLGRYVNRALVLCADYGNAAEHRRRYAALAAMVPT